MELLTLGAVLVSFGVYGFLFLRAFQKVTDLMLSVVEKTAVAVAHPVPRRELEQQSSESTAAFADMNSKSQDFEMFYDAEGNRIR